MIRNRKPLFIILGFVLLLALAVWVSDKEAAYNNPARNTQEREFKLSEKSGEVGLTPGNTAPNFTLKNLEGQTVSLKDYRGKKVILNFWATWCPPCREEMPDMQKFYSENQDKDMEILAVNLTHAEKDKKAIGEFADQYEVSFPILLDRKGETVNLFKAVSIPTTYFIDSEGTVQKVHIGPVTNHILQDITERIK
ncbi:peroxiredoxin family protein [Fictibacillus iocasae]|uniref:Peroxiredoxin family protein n=1 Tax=Fictibacillus iocasae TaxID=2715437 RepID=A0ABW2NLL2_9BACL